MECFENRMFDHGGPPAVRVRVAVLTNSLAATDCPVAHAGYARHCVALLHKGVELYELRPASGVRHGLSHRWRYASPFSLHAKLIVQDRARAIVGSLNQDPRSRLHNTEAWIVLESSVVAADLVSLFEEGTDLTHAFKVEQNKTGGMGALAWRTEEGGKTVRYDVEPMSSLWLRRGVACSVRSSPSTCFEAVSLPGRLCWSEGR